MPGIDVTQKQHLQAEEAKLPRKSPWHQINCQRSTCLRLTGRKGLPALTHSPLLRVAGRPFGLILAKPKRAEKPRDRPGFAEKSGRNLIGKPWIKSLSLSPTRVK